MPSLRVVRVAAPNGNGPAPVRDFAATVFGRDIEITWTNPRDRDFAGVLLLRSERDYPRSMLDGKVVYMGRGTVHRDTGLEPGRRYYYTVYAFDHERRYSAGLGFQTEDRINQARRCDFIAHAGGNILGKQYTNTLEAIRHNYRRGFRCFELDGNMTADDHLVAIHDWQYSYKRFFDGRAGRVPTMNRFKNLRMWRGLTQTDFGRVLHWLKRRPDAVIITDIKDGNRRGLAYLAYLISLLGKPDLFDRVIPEVFSFEDFAAARHLGFRNVLISLYAFDDDARRRVVGFARERKYIHGIAMPAEAYRLDPRTVARLRRLGIRVFVHTVNNRNTAAALRREGAMVYTDSLKPF